MNEPVIAYALTFLTAFGSALLLGASDAIAQSTVSSADYGDAPASYRDARHEISASSNLYLGNIAPDSEASTQLTSSPSAGDDDDGNDDEDAFVVLPNIPLADPSITSLSIGRNYHLTVPVTNATTGNATLHAWIDFNQNGKFEASEHQMATVSAGQTSVSLDWDLQGILGSLDLLSFPLTTFVGDTHARFRLTSDTLTDKTGLLDPIALLGIDERAYGNATDGEVEDYPVSVAVPLYDYGDAPDTNSGTEPGDYQTTESDGGPSHIIIDTVGLNLSLGNNIDGDNGGAQNANADADDIDGTSVDLLNTLLTSGDTGLNDEDGVDISSLPELTADPGQTYTIPVTVRNNIPLLNAFLVGYIDFNQDGDFDDAGEKSATVTVPPLRLGAGFFNDELRTVNVTFTTPAGIVPGETYARFRLGSVQEIVESATGTSASSSTGEINNGEVEDYKIVVAAATGGGGNTEPSDYGDAPNSYGDASHDLAASPNLYLGNVAPDGEADTQLTSAASAGDDDDGNDDEDAFFVLPNVPLVDPTITSLSIGRNYSLTVPVTNTTGNNATLHAWIDFNQDGKFEAEEHQMVTVGPGQTTASLNWDMEGILGFLDLLNFPLTTFVGDTHARFRLTSDILTDKTGLLDVLNLGIDERAIGSATDGEVEDYPVSVAVPLYDYGDAPDTGTGTGMGNYQTTESDSGPAHMVIKDPLDLLHLSLGNTVDGDEGSLQNNNADADDVDTRDVDLLSTVLDDAGLGLDDEDGVSSFPPLSTTAGQSYSVSVTVRNNIPLLNAFLVGYIDFNRDGDFDDPGERSATVTVPSDLLTITSNSLTLDTTGAPRAFDVNFTIPAGVTPGDTYARFRLGSIQEIVESATTVAVSTNNGEVNNGEVEDYKITIESSSTFTPISVGGQLIDDANYNGVLDGEETGKDDIAIRLFNLQDELQATVTTANGGLYDFGAIASGEYYVEIDLPDNTVLKGNSDGAQSSFNRVTNRSEPFAFESGTPLMLNAAIAQDTDGDKIADANEQGDRDGDNVPDYEEIDPAGFFYDETTGEILTGGSINVTGPGPDSVNLADDGADGSYEFFARENGVYTISINSPPGYEPSTACLESPGPFDPTGGPDPTSLGSGEDASTGFLVNSDCAENTFYLSFDLAAGDPFVIDNNFPFKAIATTPQYCQGTTGGFTDGSAIVPYISAEVGPDGVANRSATIGLDDDWRLAAGTAGFDSFQPWIETGPDISITSPYQLLSTADGSSVDVQVSSLDMFDINRCLGTVAAAAIQLSNSDTLQDNSPRPDATSADPTPDLYEPTDQPRFWTQTGGDSTSRNAILFEFSSPVGAFGAWFADLETRTDGGVPAILRLIDSEGDPIGEDQIIEPDPSFFKTQSDCGGLSSSDITGCGNSTTRWIGFVDPFARVSKMVVIVGDDDAGDDGSSERMSFIGATLAATSSSPDLLLVKRITAIDNNSLENPDDGTVLSDVINDNIANSSDDHPRWPNDYLVGALDGGAVRPATDVEYTIYFLSSGGMAAESVLVCDRIPSYTTFIDGAYNAHPSTGAGDHGILLNFDDNEVALTNANDGNEIADIGGYYFSAGTEPSTIFPNINCGGSNDNGAIVIDLSDIPNATGEGTPNNSYGSIRFRAIVD